jgi:hypothetical protein
MIIAKFRFMLWTSSGSLKITSASLERFIHHFRPNSIDAKLDKGKEPRGTVIVLLPSLDYWVESQVGFSRD